MNAGLRCVFNLQASWTPFPRGHCLGDPSLCNTLFTFSKVSLRVPPDEFRSVGHLLWPVSCGQQRAALSGRSAQSQPVALGGLCPATAPAEAPPATRVLIAQAGWEGAGCQLAEWALSATSPPAHGAVKAWS